jgi:putative membrane protein
MMYDNHMMGMHWIWWLLIIGSILLIILFSYQNTATRASDEDALSILKKRYARGEIEKDEYEERKQILQDMD